MKRNYDFLLFGCMAVLAAGCLTGCISNDSVVLNSNKDNNVTLDADKSVIVDWQNRLLGMPAQPDWLMQGASGNWGTFKQQYGVSNNRTVILGSAAAGSESMAENIAIMGVYWNIASEMSTKINAKLTSWADDEKAAFRELAASIRADIAGLRTETKFWQKYRTTNSMTGETKTEYVYYIVFSVPTEEYETMVKNYILSILAKMDASGYSQQKLSQVGQLYNAILEEDRVAQQTKDSIIDAETARANAEAARANQAAAEAELAAKQIDSQTASTQSSVNRGLELMYASFLQ